MLNLGNASEEIVKVTSGAGTSGSPWSITRGWDGTTAQAQGQGSSVTHMITAEDENLSRQHEALSGSASGAHGLPASAWSTAAFAAINEQTLSNSTTTAITFSSIPATYSHLLVVLQGKLTETTAQADDVVCTLNGDTTSVYSWLAQYATNVNGASTAALFGGQVTSSAVANWPFIRLAASQSGAAGNAGGGWAIIPNYTSTVFNKGFYSLSGAGDGSTPFVDMRLRCGWYNPTSQVAITSMTLTAPGTSKFTSGTFLGLYGIS